MEKSRTYLALTFLLVVGISLRISGALHGYFAFTFDQGRDFLQLFDFVYRQDFRLIGPPTGIDGVFHGVWWHWFLVPIFYLWGGDPRQVLVTFGFISAFLILIAFIWGKRLMGEKLGLIFALLVTISPHFVSTSAQLWHPNMLPLLVSILLLTLWQYIHKKWSFIYVTFLLGAVFEFEFASGGLLLLPFLIALLILKLIPSIRETLVGLGTFTFWLLPRLLFELRNNFIQTKSLIAFVNQSQPSYSFDIGSRVLERILSLFQEFTNAFAGNEKLFGVSLLIFITVVSFLVYRDSGKEIKTFMKFLLIVLVIFLVETIVYPTVLWGYYLVGIPALFMPIVGLTIWYASKYSRVMAATALTLIIIVNLHPWTYTAPEWEGDAAVFKNQLIIVKALYEEAKGRPFNVAVFSPSLIDYNYQYLFLWYGNKMYGYIPDRQEDLPLVFYIIEPDPWNKGLREGWLREREGDGQIRVEKEFPGGIMVQMRER